MADPSDIERVTNALLQIHKANFLERMTYLAISVISFVVLIIFAVSALRAGDLAIESFLALFAATGVIGVCITRILSVWKDCVNLLRDVLLKEGNR